MKVELKWKCRVGTCIVTYFAKWLLTKHLKEVHGLMVKKPKPRKLSVSKKNLQRQDHVKMNVHILEMSWLCKGEMIKRLLVMFVPKLNAKGIG